jgi:prolyl-tRNA editing enzyme YbaK/EbsC (Cys-tRNA(Pro) deacylase)
MPVLLTSTDLENFIHYSDIQGEVVRLQTPTPTVETAAQAVGVTPERIIKSILFLVDGQPLLVIAGGKARVDRRKIAARYGLSPKRVRLASPGEVLDLSGYEVGSMPPFGHLNPLPTLMDRRLIGYERDYYAGGGGENVLLRILPAEILRISQAEVLDLQEERPESASG